MLVQLNARQVDRKQSQTKGSMGTVLASAAAGPQARFPSPFFLSSENREGMAAQSTLAREIT
jgi:hypothetical protein